MGLQKRGQISLEYLFLIGFVFLLITPAILLGYEAYNDNRDTIAARQAEQAAQHIVSEAESVYYLGPPSSSKIEIFMPANIFSASIDEYAVIIRLRTQGGIDDIVATSQVKLSGTLSSNQGTHQIELEATDEGVSIS
jgi:hypothetical protein